MSNVKINLSTPPDQMWETMQDERKRARRWFNKKAGGDRGIEEIKAKARRYAITHGKENHEEFSCEWCSSDDKDVMNRWLCINNAIYSKTDTMVHARCDLLYYETNGSIGCFICQPEETGVMKIYRDGEEETLRKKTICIFTSHFFLRYCDDTRNLGEKHEDRIQILKDFALRNYQVMSPFTVNIYHTDDGQQNVDIALGGCVGRGKVTESDNVVVCEIDTCLSYEMLHKNQYRQCKNILDAWEKNFKQIQEGGPIEMPAEPVKVDTSFASRAEYTQDLFEKTKEGAKHFGNSLDLQISIDNYAPVLAEILMSMCPDINPEKFVDVADTLYTETKKLCLSWEYFREHATSWEIHDTARSYFDQMSASLHAMAKAAGTYVVFELKDVLESTELSNIRPETATEIRQRCGNSNKNNNNNNNITNRPVCDISAVTSDTKPVQTMNSVQIQELKRVLKDNGVKNFNTLPQSFSLNSDRYLELAEPIYAISRLLPYVNSDNDRQKMMKAQKAWMNIVIQKQWCSALDSYIQEHGKTLVQMAVEYCIDNDLWDSPKGNTALRTHTADHFKGLEAIDEAVEYLKGEGFVDDTNKEESPKQDGYNTEVLDAQSESLVEFVDEAKKPNGYQNIIDNVQSSALDDVYTADLVPGAFEHMKELLAKSLFITRNLEQYVNACVNPSDLQKENARLSARVRSLEAQIDVKTDEAKAAKEEAQKAKDERNEVQQNYTKKSQEYDRIVKVKREQADIIKQQGEEIKRLNTEIEKGTEALNKLKEQQKSSLTLPKRRILKESEILNLPLVGAKMISVLEPYLAKHDIIIDHNK